MKKLILKFVFFLLIIFSIMWLILYYYGGRIDSFYNKFTTPKTNSMIIGDSGSLEGILPSIIDKKLKGHNFELPMLNYSFTIAQAPIGPLYRKSILKKLEPDTKNGLFIISINPLMLISKKGEDNYKNEFTEANQPPHNMTFVDVNPNFEYLIKNYGFFHFKAIFRNKIDLHKDGWLQDNNIPTTSLDFETRKQTWIDSYDSFFKGYEISNYRLKSFDTLINVLKNYGKVYIVRMPVDKAFIPLESKIYPNFTQTMDSLTHSNNIRYYDYATIKNSHNFKTLDGVHLNKYAGEKFTSALCDSIIVDITNINYGMKNKSINNGFIPNH